MIIEISSSGGFAGSGRGLSKRIDVDAQAEPIRQELCEAFEPDDLERLTAKSRNSGGADIMTYRIIVTDDDHVEHTYDIREDRLPPETLDLIDQF